MSRFNFPLIPDSKLFKEKHTAEQAVLTKLISNERISSDEEALLNNVCDFYFTALAYLKQINLSDISESDAVEILKYLADVFRFDFIFQNKGQVHNLFRVSRIKPEFLVGDKVRDLKFITYPDIEIIRQIGEYGRANTPSSTCFYCSADPSVAVLETKPMPTDRIILSRWWNHTGILNSFPIGSKNVANENARHAADAFAQRMALNHPLFAKVINYYMDFLTSEFIKDVKIFSKKKYEYLFSSYFAESILLHELDIPLEPLRE